MRRVICFANREIGADIARDLNSLSGVELALVVVHNKSQAEIDLSFLSSNVPVLSWKDFLQELPRFERTFDAGLSVLFGHFIPTSVMDLVDDGIVNLHPSYLPYGRGKYPATWAIWEETPYGVSAHQVTSELDAGPLLDQFEIPILASDTSDSLYTRGIRALWDLYMTSVRPWVLGKPVTWKAQTQGGSSHRQADLQYLRDLATQTEMPVVTFVKLLRALSMGPGSGLVLRGSSGEILVQAVIEERTLQQAGEDL